MLSVHENLLADFSRTTDQVFSLDEFKALLASGRQLRIKFGVDVTAPHLHIGHAVNLWMMRRLQDLGHKVIFLIGDFTTRIGDPTGRNKLRPVIEEKDIQANTRNFIEQARLVLRFDNPHLLEIRKNSEWLNALKTEDLIKLLSMITHKRLLSRDMFQKRIGAGEEIHMHEILYPVLQGYDSVALQSDLTIIGSDQLFNEMVGRFYQERMGQKPQVIITTRITPGIDGGEKQSKSRDNYIGLAHSPRDKFGRAMRVPDNLIADYFDIYSEIPASEMEHIRQQVTKDPFGCKKQLAWTIVARYHGPDIASSEQAWFEKTFSRGEIPESVPVLHLDALESTVFDVVRRYFGPAKSNSEIRRLIVQGAVEVRGEHIQDPYSKIRFNNGDLVKAGKRVWFKISRSNE